MVVWKTELADNLKGQILDEMGGAVGNEFQINTSSLGNGVI